MASLRSETFCDEDKERIKKWIEESKSLSILLTGKTGAGKSSLANALVGEQVSPEGETLDAQTTEVSSLEATISGVAVTIWDTPGLQDGTDQDEQYLRKIADKCKGLDLVLYCTKMNDSRIREEDYEAIRKLTLAFGEEVWLNAVFALTFANYVKPTVRRRQQSPPDPKQYFLDHAVQWQTKLREVVEKANVSKEIVNQIPVVPVGYQTEPALPDRDDWLSSFWVTCLSRMKERAKPALLKLNVKRLQAGLERQPSVGGDSKVIPIMSDDELVEEAVLRGGAGFAIGALLGLTMGPVGMVVGGAAGIAVGEGTFIANVRAMSKKQELTSEDADKNDS